MLTSEFWQEKHAITGTAQGRGTTWFIGHQDQDWVLKHYYRGGLIGKVLKDSYWFTQLEHTRAIAEFKLLQHLSALSLPAPTPIACGVYRSGPCYRADILTSKIKYSKDLVGILTQQSIDNSLWKKVGQTIKQFHNEGIYHHDLNIHNILIDDDEKVWLIDFDRAKVITPDINWQQANLDRLQRSFYKERGKLSPFYWQEEQFEQLLLGYNLTR